MKLLTTGTNAKTVKSDTIQDEYLTAILYLAPYKVAKVGNVCLYSTKGCRFSCLFTAGRGAYNSVKEARVRKTRYFYEDRSGFLSDLATDIFKFSKKCRKLGKKPAVRLNGTSDISWEDTGIISLFPNVQFYDYTKNPNRFNETLPSNYDLTFSLTEDTLEVAKKLLSRNINVAVVFNTSKKDNKPKKYLGVKVIDGDTHDLRFLDKKVGYFIGLSAKGRARRDNTGFVRKVIR